jgi:hypothetical protein
VTPLSSSEISRRLEMATRLGEFQGRGTIFGATNTQGEGAGELPIEKSRIGVQNAKVLF